MTNYGFIRLPRAFLTDSTWCNFTSRDQHAYMTFLINMAFKDHDLDCRGILIKIRPGQYLTTERAFADLCNAMRPKDMEEFDKSFIHRWLVKMERCHFSNHESNQGKTIITCTRTDIMELIEPEIEPKVNQNRTKSEPQTKNDKKDDKEKKLKNDSVSDCSYVHNSPPISEMSIDSSCKHPNESIEKSFPFNSEIKIVSDRSSTFDIDSFTFPDKTHPTAGMVGTFNRGDNAYREKFISNLGYCQEQWDAGKKPRKSYEIMLQDAITNDYMKKEMNKIRNKTWTQLQVQNLYGRGIKIKIAQTVVQLFQDGQNIDSISFDHDEETFHWKFESMINYFEEKYGG